MIARKEFFVDPCFSQFSFHHDPQKIFALSLSFTRDNKHQKQQSPVVLQKIAPWSSR